MFLRCLALVVLAEPMGFGVGQDAFSPARTYVLGEKDAYGLSMRLDAGQYMMSISSTLNYEVRKVHENGDADVESKSGEMTVNVLGDVLKQPAGEPRIVRYNRFGAPLEKEVPKGDKQPTFMKFLSYRTSSPMALGAAVKIDETLADATKTRIQGTAKLESLSDGVAKVISNLEVAEAKGKKPTKIASIGYFDVKTSKLNRLEAKVTDVDPAEMQGLPPISSITIVIERVK